MADTFEFGNPEIIEEEVDILIIGGGMAACGAAFEVMRWTEGTGLKVKLVDKAAMDRSGAVAQDCRDQHLHRRQRSRRLCALRPQRPDGIVREDLIYDVGRHVDDSVHTSRNGAADLETGRRRGQKLTAGGKPVRSGKWQIMINGESYKWIVAEAAKKALGMQNVQERVFIVRMVTDKNIRRASPAPPVSRCATTSSMSTSSSAVCWLAAAP